MTSLISKLLIAALLLLTVFAVAANAQSTQGVILVADNPADLAVASSIANHLGYTIVITPWGEYDTDTLGRVTNLNPTDVIVLGSFDAVPASYSENLVALGHAVEVVGGDTRQQTSLIAYDAYGAILGLGVVITDGSTPVVTANSFPIYVYNNPGEVEQFVISTTADVNIISGGRAQELAAQLGSLAQASVITPEMLVQMDVLLNELKKEALAEGYITSLAASDAVDEVTNSIEEDIATTTYVPATFNASPGNNTTVTLTVVTPNGGELVSGTFVASATLIDSANQIDSLTVSLVLYDPSGSPTLGFYFLQNITPSGSGTYSITADSTPYPDNYYYKIEFETVYSSTSLYDESDSYFTINNTPVAAPPDSSNETNEANETLPPVGESSFFDDFDQNALHSRWETGGGQGSVELDDGTYLQPASYGSGTGWHGPEIEAPVDVDGDFTVRVGLKNVNPKGTSIHDSGAIGGTIVLLLDANDNLVYRFPYGDPWANKAHSMASIALTQYPAGASSNNLHYSGPTEALKNYGLLEDPAELRVVRQGNTIRFFDRGTEIALGSSTALSMPIAKIKLQLWKYSTYNSFTTHQVDYVGLSDTADIPEPPVVPPQPPGNGTNVTNQTNVTAGGLVAHWNFNDPAVGRYTLDQVGSNNLELQGASLTVESGSISTDGRNDYPRIDSSSAFNIDNSLTIAVRLKPINQPNSATSIDTLIARANKFWLWHDGTKTVFESGCSPWGPDLIGPAIPDNEWAHVVIVKTTNTHAKMYIDGTLVVEGNIYAPCSGSGRTYVGSWNGVNHFLSARTDDIKIWNKALTSSEVQAEYNTYTIPQPPGNETNQTNETVAGVVTIVSPNGGEPLSGLNNIQWTVTGVTVPASATADVRIAEFWSNGAHKTDHFVTNTVLASAGSTSFNFNTLANGVKYKARIHIYGATLGSSSDFSDAYFSIVSPSSDPGNETNQPPVINSMTVTPSSGEVPLILNMVASASDSDGDTLTYTWNFGDGTAEELGPQRSYVYETAGVFTARVTVTDSNGGSDTETRTVTVTSPASGNGTNGTTPVVDGLVAHWAFSNNLQDAVGSNDGSSVGGPVFSGQALQVDGVNDYVSVPDSNSLDLTNTGTISFWLKADEWNNYETFIRKADSGGWCTNSRDEGFNIFNNANGLIYLSMCGSQHSTVSIPRPTLAAWHLYTFTWDGTTLTSYLDGTLVTTGVQNSAMAPNTDPVLIGKGGYWNVNRWADVYVDGTFDEVKLWDRALSSSEVAVEYGSYDPPSGASGAVVRIQTVFTNLLRLFRG